LLKRERKRHGLTREQLSEMCDVSPQTVRNYETGDHDPKMKVFLRLCHALQCSADTLLFSPSEGLAERIGAGRVARGHCDRLLNTEPLSTVQHVIALIALIRRTRPEGAR